MSYNIESVIGTFLLKNTNNDIWFLIMNDDKSTIISPMESINIDITCINLYEYNIVNVCEGKLNILDESLTLIKDNVHYSFCIIGIRMNISSYIGDDMKAEIYVNGGSKYIREYGYRLFYDDNMIEVDQKFALSIDPKIHYLCNTEMGIYIIRPQTYVELIDNILPKIIPHEVTS